MKGYKNVRSWNRLLVTSTPTSLFNLKDACTTPLLPYCKFDFYNTKMSAHSANPGNFANRPTEEVKAIASMGGKASHGPHKDSEVLRSPHYIAGSMLMTMQDEQPQEASHAPGRNADGTFTKGSEAAAQAGHLGGLHAHQKIDEKVSPYHPFTSSVHLRRLY